MHNLNRRDFLKSLGLVSGGLAIGATTLVSGCSIKKSSSQNKTSTTSATSNQLAAIVVSSDLHKSPLAQRLAFSIFSGTKIAAKGAVPVTLTSPSGKKQQFDSVALREKGIPGSGIYSLHPVLDEVGVWDMSTKFNSKPLTLSVQVHETSDAPSVGSPIPNEATPTNKNPMDASILCTRFEGNCGLHDHSVDELLAKKKPFAVIFATPARCQTSYCGPVLDLTRNAKRPDLDVIHIEIYQNDKTTDVLKAVKDWNLPSEPWLFGVDATGNVTARLDGAFDQSEIEELLKNL